MRKASSGVPAPAADTAAVDEVRLPSASNGDSGVPALDRDKSLPLRAGNAALKQTKQRFQFQYVKLCIILYLKMFL